MKNKQVRSTSVATSIKDPYIGFNIQEEDVKKYKYRTGNLLFLIWLLAVFLAGIFFIFILRGGGSIRSLFGALFIITSVYYLSMLPSAFLCTPDQLIVFYYFRPSIHIYWADIFELRIKWKRGISGYVIGPARSIQFPLNKLNDLENQQTFLRTVAARANLHFIGGYVGNELNYRKE